MTATLYIYDSANFSYVNKSISECVCAIYTSSETCKLTDAEADTLAFGVVFLFIIVMLLLAIIGFLFKPTRILQHTRNAHLN
jgi:zona occludens toxin (predicted ATPase)